MSTSNYKKKEEKQKALKERKKGRLKFMFKTTIALIGILLISLVVIAAMFEKQIAGMVISTLNKQLKTELKVSEASLSLIWKFPKAAVYLHNAQIDDLGGSDEKLLDVGSISLECSIMGLLMGNYHFNSISINNGSLFIHTDSKGNVNYDIFKPSDETPDPNESSDLYLEISNTTLANVTIHYLDETTKQDLKIKAKSAYFEGDFMIDNKLNKNKHTITSYAELYSEYVTINETTYLRDKELAYDGSVNLDLANRIYSFEKIKLFLQGNQFTANGSVAKVDKGMEYNMTFGSPKAMLSSLLQLIPAQYADILGQFENYGNLSFEARVNGISSARSNPVIEVNFGLKDGRVSHPSMAASMKDVSFDVKFTNGNGIDDKTAKLSLIGFKASLNNEPINLTWQMDGLKDPMISMTLDGRIPLNAVYGFFGEQVTKGSGLIEIERFSLNGRLHDMTSMNRIPRVNLAGSINFNQAYLMMNNIPVNIKSGGVSLENNALNVSNITFNTDASDFIINGAFQNVLPVLLSDSINSQDAKLTFQASFNSKNIDADELLAIFSGRSIEEIKAAPEEEQDSLTKETYERREFRTSFLQGSFITSIDNFKYGKIEAKNFKGSVDFTNSVMNLKGVKVEAMDGSFELNSKIFFEKEPHVELYLDCKDIDIQAFLSQLDNFGQDVLTSNNLRGKLESLIKINLFMDSLGNFKHDDLYVVADVKLKQGELINVKMFESFSTFIKMKDLQHIVFTELKNQFKIEHGKFIMPAMFIQSNALNILVGGSYNFNHDMDFKLKINAGQVLASKFKKHNPDKIAIKAKQQGLFNIYAHIFGNVDGNIDYKIGPKDTKKHLDAQLAQDLPAIANTLQAEFNNSLGRNTAPVVQVMKLPTEWEDIPEFDGDDTNDYIEGF